MSISCAGSLIRILFLYSLILISPAVNGQEQQELPEQESSVSPDEESLEDILSGFEDEEPLLADPSSKQSDKEDRGKLKSKNTHLKGFTQTSLSYNYAHSAPEPSLIFPVTAADYRGLSQLKQSLQLEWEATVFDRWKIFLSGSAYYDLVYGVHGRDGYIDRLLEKQEKEAELRQVYIQGSLSSNLDIKVGRQLIVWGKSDNLRVVDILNPLDNREPGMTDLEDLRLPVTMTRIDYYRGNWNLGVIAIHETRFNKNPPFGSEFYPFPVPKPQEKKPENSEYALSLDGRFSGWDISFYGARYYDDQPHFNGSLLEHSRLSMWGMAANIAIGNWLLKSEIAYIDDLEFGRIGNKTFSRTDLLLGTEYTGFDETTISLEIVNRHLNQFDLLLEGAPDYQQKNAIQSVLRYQRDFKHQTWHLLILASAFGPGTQGGSFKRLELKYDIADAVSLSIGVVAYQAGDHAVFGSFGDNDRVFFKFRTSF